MKMPQEKDEKILHIKGKGKLISKECVVSSTFKLEFYLGSQAMLFIDLNMSAKERQLIHEKDIREFSFEGTLKDNTKLSIQRVILISQGDIKNGVQKPLKLKVFSEISLNRKDYTAKHNERIIFKITNLEFTGTEKTITPSGGWSLDHFSLNISGYPIEVRQIKDYKEIIKGLKKKEFQTAQTAEIIIKAKHADQDKVRKIILDLCWLMSYAKGNTIVPFGELHVKEDKIIHWIYRSMRIEPFKGGDHVIPDLPFEAFPGFLEETFEKYLHFKEELGMDVILNYYELMKRNPILDTRCVLGFVLLECLSNNAQEYYNAKGKPITSSLMRSKIKKLRSILAPNDKIGEETIQKLISEFIYKYPTLQDSINQLMEDFGMKYKRDEGKIFELRKEFIHKGRFPKETNNHIEIYHRIIHFVDRLILHILGYTGSYLDVSDGYKEKKLIYEFKKK